MDEFDAIRAVFSGPVVRYEELKEEPGIVLSRVVNELGLKEDSGPEMAVREGVINSSFSADLINARPRAGPLTPPRWGGSCPASGAWAVTHRSGVF